MFEGISMIWEVICDSESETELTHHEIVDGQRPLKVGSLGFRSLRVMTAVTAVTG